MSNDEVFTLEMVNLFDFLEFYSWQAKQVDFKNFYFTKEHDCVLDTCARPKLDGYFGDELSRANIFIKRKNPFLLSKIKFITTYFTIIVRIGLML